MRSLVTGGTGYLGGRLVERLLAVGDEVRALRRRTSDVSRLSGAVTLVEGDVTDLDSLVRACEGCDRMFHTAALVKTWTRDPKDFDRVNVQGTLNMCEAARRLGRPLVYTSSFFALGPTGPEPIDEEHVRRTDPYCTHYERTKTLADIEVRQLLKDGLNAVVVYPGLVYGPGPLTQGNYVSIMVRDFLRRRVPGVPGDGTQRWTYAYIDDVVEGHLLAAEKGEAGDRYILGGPVVSLDESFGALAAVTGLPAPRIHLPIGALVGFGWLGDLYAGVTGNAPAVTRGVVETYRRHWAYDSSKAERELGYRMKPLEQGLENVVNYVKGFAV
jgi:farnesol dehydrogenase